MRPVAIPSYLKQLWAYSREEMTTLVRSNNIAIQKGTPDVSVVIPAYNEEENILPALLSISQNKTRFSVEIIVVNNNSKDNTEALVRATGVTCINEITPGVTNARNAGLAAATGKYMLNADSDSIYPPDWIETMISPLAADEGIAITYGRFSFMPSGSAARFTYFVYENLADILRWSKKKFREEAMNVYGCNSGFRRAQCLEVNGYEHPPGTNEDGWLAIKLREKGFGRLHYVPDPKAMVWTVDRHLQKDGGLWKALIIRVKQVIKPLPASPEER